MSKRIVSICAVFAIVSLTTLANDDSDIDNSQVLTLCATGSDCLTIDINLDPDAHVYKENLESAAELLNTPAATLPEELKKSIPDLVQENKSAIASSQSNSQYINETNDETVRNDAQDFSENFELSDSSELWKTAQKAQALLGKAIQKKKETGKYAGIEGFIFISLSIPENDLRTLIQEVDATGRKVAFVLRGFQPYQYKHLVKKIIEIEKTIANRLLIDPTLFQRYQVEQVPTFILKYGPNTWKRTQGNVSLKFALEHFNKSSQFETLGKTYEIEEPDILKLLQERVANTDWDQWVEDQTNGVKERDYQFGLKVAHFPNSYLVDPTYTIQKDIVIKGHTFGKAGQKINPLAIMPLSKCYIFADFTDPDHLRAVDKLIEDCPSFKAVTVSLPGESLITDKVKKYGELGTVNPIIKARMQLTHIPAKAEQDDLDLRLTVLPPISKELSDD